MGAEQHTLAGGNEDAHLQLAVATLQAAKCFREMVPFMCWGRRWAAGRRGPTAGHFSPSAHAKFGPFSAPHLASKRRDPRPRQSIACVIDMNTHWVHRVTSNRFGPAANIFTSTSSDYPRRAYICYIAYLYPGIPGVVKSLFARSITRSRGTGSTKRSKSRMAAAELCRLATSAVV
eukprot:1837683-Pleurochrysis_carterae.AAC.3